MAVPAESSSSFHTEERDFNKLVWMVDQNILFGLSQLYKFYEFTAKYTTKKFISIM